VAVLVDADSWAELEQLAEEVLLEEASGSRRRRRRGGRSS
jgi:hypothetical protein